MKNRISPTAVELIVGLEIPNRLVGFAFRDIRLLMFPFPVCSWLVKQSSTSSRQLFWSISWSLFSVGFWYVKPFSWANESQQCVSSFLMNWKSQGSYQVSAITDCVTGIGNLPCATNSWFLFPPCLRWQWGLPRYVKQCQLRQVDSTALHCHNVESIKNILQINSSQ